MAYGLVLLPIVAYYLIFLVRYAHTLFLRRDENIMLAIFAEIERGRPIGEIFTMIIGPGFLSTVFWLTRLVDLITLGRLIGMLGAVGSAVLTAAIARRLFREPLVGLFTLALMTGSTLLVSEGTVFRLNLPSLAWALGGTYLLLPAHDGRTDEVRLLPWLAAGLLFGIALQLKPLVLAMGPLVLYLLYVRGALSVRKLPSLLLHAAGWLAPTLVSDLLTRGGSRVDAQLGMHLGALGQVDPTLWLNQSIATCWVFATAHLWLLIFFILSLYLGFARTGEDLVRPALRLLSVWAGGGLVVLLLNFPTWDHHYVYLLPPLAIGAAYFLDSAGQLIAVGAGLAPGAARLGLTAPALICVSIAAAGTFASTAIIEREQLTPDVLPIAQRIAQRTAPGDIIWSDNLVFTLLAQRPTDPWLVDISIKRIIAGQLTEEELFRRFERQPPAAVIVYDGLLNAFPDFLRCLQSVATVEPISSGGQWIFWVNRTQAPKLTACQ